jgi:hypothetical protein
MGCGADQPYESCSILYLASPKKGKYFNIKDRLNNLRNSFTFAANFIVLGLGLIIFSSIESQQGGLFLITAIGLSLGIAASIFFLWNIKEKLLTINH